MHALVISYGAQNQLLVMAMVMTMLMMHCGR